MPDGGGSQRLPQRPSQRPPETAMLSSLAVANKQGRSEGWGAHENRRRYQITILETPKLCISKVEEMVRAKTELTDCFVVAKDLRLEPDGPIADLQG